MNNERIKMLEKFIADTPDDPFNYYALAIELADLETERSLEIFNHLLDKFPDYLPTYYQASLQFQKLNRLKEAIKVARAGMALASRLNEIKVYRELAQLIDIWD